MIQEQVFHKGDLRVGPRAFLRDKDGLAFDGTPYTVKFRLIREDGTQVFEAAAVWLNTVTTEVGYTWTAGQTDVAGTYAGYFVLELAGKREHYPVDRTYRIVIRAD